MSGFRPPSWHEKRRMEKRGRGRMVESPLRKIGKDYINLIFCLRSCFYTYFESLGLTLDDALNEN
jgi:hypothetical protein